MTTTANTIAAATAHSFNPAELATMKARELATLEAAIGELERARVGLSNILLGEGYIVRVQGVCVDYAIDPTTRKVTTDGTGQPHRVRRFTKADAEHLAAITLNGNKVAGEAVHVRHAVEQSLEELRVVADLFRG